MSSNIDKDIAMFKKSLQDTKQWTETFNYMPTDFFGFLNYICNGRIKLSARNSGFFEINKHIVEQCSVFFDVSGAFTIINNKNRERLLILRGSNKKTGKYVTKDDELVNFFKTQCKRIESVSYNKNHVVMDSKYILKNERALYPVLFGDGEPMFKFKSHDDMSNFFVETWKIVDCLEVTQKNNLIICGLSMLGVFCLAFTPGSCKIILSGGSISSNDLKNMVDEMSKNIEDTKIMMDNLSSILREKLEYPIGEENQVFNKCNNKISSVGELYSKFDEKNISKNNFVKESNNEISLAAIEFEELDDKPFWNHIATTDSGNISINISREGKISVFDNDNYCIISLPIDTEHDTFNKIIDSQLEEKSKKNVGIIRKFKTLNQMKEYLQLLKMDTKFDICGFNMEGGIEYKNEVNDSSDIYYCNYNMNDNGEYIVGINKNTQITDSNINKLKNIMCIRKFKTFDILKNYLQLLNFECKFTIHGFEENGGIVYQMSLEDKLYNTFYVLDMDNSEYIVTITHKVNII